ncbi:MAG: DUF58 domain-containing protein [bacterium]
MNLRRLNYILIRGNPESWERWARGRLARTLRPLVAPVLVLTPEGQGVFLATMVAGAAGMDVQFSNLYLVFCGLFGLLAAAWLGRLVFARPGPLAVSVRCPPRVAAGEVATFTIRLDNPGRAALYALRIFGPFLDWDGTWVVRRPSLPTLAAGGRAEVIARARFLQRGHRWIGRFSAASVRPLGLAFGPRITSAPVRLTVVPRTVRLLGLPPPHLVPEDLGEAARGITTGADYELAGLRPYRPGDRIRDLHALSWARLGEPMVRTFRRTARRRAVVLFHAQAPRADEAAFEAAVSLAASLVRFAVGAGATTTLVIAGATTQVVVVGPQSAPRISPSTPWPWWPHAAGPTTPGRGTSAAPGPRAWPPTASSPAPAPTPPPPRTPGWWPGAGAAAQAGGLAVVAPEALAGAELGLPR